jgi:SNF2 family DNA or RNA helicase
MNLDQLAKRIKGGRMFVGQKRGIRRLYFRYGMNGRGIKTSTWFEVINDRLELKVRVENDRHPNYYDTEKEQRYHSELMRQFHELIHDCELERKKVPLHDRLRDDVVPVYSADTAVHQVQALRFMCSMKVSALFADTGTMKTKMSLDLAESRYQAGQIRKVLVCCPVSTKRNFRDEIKKWHPDAAWECLIVGHETLSQSDRTYLQTLRWVDSETMVIVDESHFCKTPTAKRAKRVLSLCDRTSYKIIMTGTPTENVRDIYMQYTMLSHLITGCRNWIQFEERYLILGGYDGTEVIGYKNIDQLMGLLEPYTYQVRKEDVLDLPAKSEHVLYCGLNADQWELYERTKQSLMDELEKWEELPAHILFRHLTMLQQICCGFFRDRDGQVRPLGNPKLGKLDETGYSDGQTVFFCKYLHEVGQLVEYLGAENCAVFTGENRGERDLEKDLFTRGEKKYFVATMSSGGTGLNGLQGCSRIVFLSNSYKWRERKQCVGRIDRMGQRNRMEIWDVQTDTGMEHRIRQNIARKGNLADEIRELLYDKTKLKQYVEEL